MVETLPIVVTALLVIFLGWLVLVSFYAYVVKNGHDFSMQFMSPAAWQEPGAAQRATERGLGLQRRALRRLLRVWPLMAAVFTASVVLFVIAGTKG